MKYVFFDIDGTIRGKVEKLQKEIKKLFVN